VSYSQAVLPFGYGAPPKVIGPNDGLRIHEFATKREAWNRVGFRTYERVLFTPDSTNLVVLQNGIDAVEMLDSATGISRARISLGHAIPRSYWHSPRIEFTRDGATLLIAQPHQGLRETLLQRFFGKIGVDPARVESGFDDATIVCDMHSMRERIRLPGRGTLDALLSEDGGILVTHEPRAFGIIVHCWDVDGFKPFRWAVGIPASLGAVVFLLAKARRRREPAKPAMPSPLPAA
jgi:hypothetical protein